MKLGTAAGYHERILRALVHIQSHLDDALPLDELPGHDGVPLVVFTAAFCTAGLILGSVARALRLDRMTAGLALAAGTGIWLLFVDTFCLLVVRQVPASEALHTAARLQPVYLAAVLAGAGGALLGTGVRPTSYPR